MASIFCLSNYLTHGETADEFEVDLTVALDSVLVVVEPHEVHLSPDDERRRVFDWALLEECYVNHIEAAALVVVV